MNQATTRAEFAEFAQARQRHLMRTAYLLCGSWEGAEDLTQTALYELCRAWGRARRADSVDAYAHRTLINAFLAQQRRSKRERAARVDLDPELVLDVAARPDQTDSGSRRCRSAGCTSTTSSDERLFGPAPAR